MANYYLSTKDYFAVKPWGGHTNLLLQSQTFNTTWVAAQLDTTPFPSTNNLAPDGTNTAYFMAEGAGTNSHYVYQTISRSAVVGNYVLSVYLKAGANRKTAWVSLTDSTAGTNSTTVGFDLVDGVLLNGSGTGTVVQVRAWMEPAANGFWRCCLVGTIPASITTLYCKIGISSSTGTATNIVTSYAGTAGGSYGIYLWGAMLNQGNAPHAYAGGTTTTTTAVTTAGSFSASSGAIIRQNANIGYGASGAASERCFRCTTAGTTGASEPYWNTAPNGTTTDGSAVWTECTGQEAYQGTGSSPWLAPCPDLQYAITGTNLIRVTGLGSPTFTTTSGFVTGDIVKLSTGTVMGNPCIASVTASAGAITALTLLDGGQYSVAPTAGGGITAVTGSGVATTVSVTPTTGTGGLMAAGDTGFMAANAFNSYNAWSVIASIGATTSASSGWGSLLCTNQNGNKPPVAADLVTSPSCFIGTLNGVALTIQGCFYIHGAMIIPGGGASTATLTLASTTNNSASLNHCAIGTMGSGAVTLGNGIRSGVSMNDTGLHFGSTSGSVTFSNCTFTWKNSVAASTVIGGSVALPTTFVLTGQNCTGTIEGVDFSAFTNKTIWAYGNGFASVLMKDCKLPTGAVMTNITSGFAAAQMSMSYVRCDSGTGSSRNEHWQAQGSTITSTTVVRTSGASDGTTPFSHQMVAAFTHTGDGMLWPVDGFPVSEWNTKTPGTATTVTIEGICSLTALPTSAQLYFDVEYLGDSGSPMGSINSGARSSPLDTGSTVVTASTSAWDSAATARANSTAYALGTIIKTASNPGRLFICTVAGTSAGSEPGSYASATDTTAAWSDGTATFRPMVRFKYSVSVTAQQVGPITVYPKVCDPVAAASGLNTYYIDPLLTLT